MERPGGYQVRIRVQGELSPAWWSGVFVDLLIAGAPDGTTLLSGFLPDQAALHGLLATVRDLGLSIVSVETVAAPPPTHDEAGGSQR